MNPRLADEQVRGGRVQGLGGALYEHCVYDDNAQLVNGTMADYLTPMSPEMPDIDVAHVETSTGVSELGGKGVGARRADDRGQRRARAVRLPRRRPAGPRQGVSAGRSCAAQPHHPAEFHYQH